MQARSMAAAAGSPAHLRPDKHQSELVRVVDLSSGAQRARSARSWRMHSAGVACMLHCGGSGHAPNVQVIRTCHALPTLTVTKVWAPRRCTANFTSAVMYPSALKGWNSAEGASIRPQTSCR